MIFSESFVEWAGNNFDEYRKICLDIVKNLNLERTHITFVVGDHDNAFCDVESRGYSINFSKNHKINSNFVFSFVAAHELRHVWQYENKKLSKDSLVSLRKIFRVWENMLLVFPYERDMDYFLLPWEMDANIFSREYAEKNFKKELNVDRLYDKIVLGILRNMDDIHGNRENGLPYESFKSEKIESFGRRYFENLENLFKAPECDILSLIGLEG